MYCTVDRIKIELGEDRLAQLTDDAQGKKVNDAVVTAAITDADALIDSYCSTRYSVPFTPVPDVIESASVTITVAKLTARRQFTLDESRQKSHDATIAWLRDVARGLANVTGAEAPPRPSTQAQGTYTSEERIMTREKLSGY